MRVHTHTYRTTGCHPQLSVDICLQSAHSSKPTTRQCCCRSMWQTDGQTTDQLCGQSEITSYAMKVLNGLWNQNVFSKPTLLLLDSRTFDVVHRFLLAQSARYDLARLMYHLSRLATALGTLPSVLWRCWLGGRKDIRPVKTEWWGAGVVICLERGADLHMSADATATHCLLLQ